MPQQTTVGPLLADCSWSRSRREGGPSPKLERVNLLS